MTPSVTIYLGPTWALTKLHLILKHLWWQSLKEQADERDLQDLGLGCASTTTDDNCKTFDMLIRQVNNPEICWKHSMENSYEIWNPACGTRRNTAASTNPRALRDNRTWTKFCWRSKFMELCKKIILSWEEALQDSMSRWTLWTPVSDGSNCDSAVSTPLCLGNETGLKCPIDFKLFKYWCS